MSEDQSVKEGLQRGSVASTILRCVIFANLALISLSWSTWFEGTAEHPGAADRLFGGGNGFRPDFEWLIFSTLAIFFAGWFYLIQFRDRRSARINAYLCIAEVVAFCLAVRHFLLSGTLYFG